jgi:uncharacterized protein YecE (DUF72 family)
METPTPSAKLHIGALLDRAPGPKYLGALGFAELGLRAPLPRPATLAQMRKQLPAGFAIAIRAPRASVVSSLGPLRTNAELESSLAWLLGAADAADAQAVVISTPAELTPGARSRDLLREYVARLPQRPGRIYVWSPAGVWEPHDMHALATELGLVCAFDPLEARRPPGPIAYATLRALGHRTGFTPAALGDALARLLTPETEVAYLSVDADRGFDIARRTKQLATALAAMSVGAATELPDDEDDDLGEDEDEDESDEEEESDSEEP